MSCMIQTNHVMMGGLGGTFSGAANLICNCQKYCELCSAHVACNGNVHGNVILIPSQCFLAHLIWFPSSFNINEKALESQ